MKKIYMTLIGGALLLSLTACGEMVDSVDVTGANNHAQKTASASPMPTPSPTPVEPLSISTLYEKAGLPFGTPAEQIYGLKGPSLEEKAAEEAKKQAEEQAAKSKKSKKKTDETAAADLPLVDENIRTYEFNTVDILETIAYKNQTLAVHSLATSAFEDESVAQLEFNIFLENEPDLSQRILDAASELCRKEPDDIQNEGIRNPLVAKYYLDDFYVELSLIADVVEELPDADNGLDNGVEGAVNATEGANGVDESANAVQGASEVDESANAAQEPGITAYPDELIASEEADELGASDGINAIDASPEPTIEPDIEIIGYTAILRVYPSDYEEALVGGFTETLNDIQLPAQEAIISEWIERTEIYFRNEQDYVFVIKGEPEHVQGKNHYYPGVDIFDLSPERDSVQIKYSGADEVNGIIFDSTAQPADGSATREFCENLVDRVIQTCGTPLDQQASTDGYFSWEGKWRTTRFDIVFQVDELESGKVDYKMSLSPKGTLKI